MALADKIKKVFKTSCELSAMFIRNCKKLLLLDEPVTGLDPIVTAEFYQLISRINKESGIAVVMVSHDIESAVEYASHILHLQETVLYFGKADGYEKSRAGKTFLGGETHV